MTRRHSWPAAALAAVALLMAATPAHAACAVTAESVAAADVVFVGVLRAVDRTGVATFEIEEVWRGQQFITGEMVNVEAANVGIEVPPNPDVQSATYLVLASERDGVFRTGDAGSDLCARYAAFRPAQPAAQSQETFSAVGIPWLPVLIGAAVIISIAAFVIGGGGRRSQSK